MRGDAMGVLRRTVRELRNDNMSDWAAALTYYGLLSVFPALIAFVSIVLVADPKLNSAREQAKELEEGRTEAVEELQLPPRVAP